MRRTITFWLAFGFFAAMIAMLFIPPAVSLWQYDAAPATANCSSIIQAGWPATDRQNGYAIAGLEDLDSEVDFNDASLVCEHRRTAFVALIGVLAVPATALLTISIIPTRVWPEKAKTKPDSEDPSEAP